MSLRKFISGVTAFAVAASAFAAMAVTASAYNYPVKAITPATKNNITGPNDKGIFTTNGTDTEDGYYALALADFSDLPNIDKAATITIEFKTAIYNQRMVFVLGDKTIRGDNAAGSAVGSNEIQFNYNGVAMFFGSSATNEYAINGTTIYKIGGENNIVSPFGKTVTARVVIDKKTKRIQYRLTDSSNNLLAEDTTGIPPHSDNAETINIIEAFSWKTGVQALFKDVKVSYTVPDPSANLVAASWEVTDAATGYIANKNVLKDAKGNSVYGYKATLEGNGIEYNTVNVYAKVADGEANNEKPYTDTKFGGSGYATFYVISDTALDTDASRVYCK